jgi:hypothetical protein
MEDIMTARTSVLALAAGAIACASPAIGQDAASENANSITVTVNYALNLPVQSEDIEAQTKAMRDSRQILYKMAVGECRLLMQTIASSCTLSRLNAQSNMSSRRPAQTILSISANAQYQVVIKSQD